MASALPRTARVAVIGAGAMGIDIVQVAAQAGHPVALFDVRDGAAAAAVATLRRRLAELAIKGRITQHTADTASERIAAVDTLAGCANAEIVIEAIAQPA